MVLDRSIVALVAAMVAVMLVPRAGVTIPGRAARRGWHPATRRAALAGSGVAAAAALLALPWWAVLVAGGLAALAVRRVPGGRRGPSLTDLRDLAAALDLMAVCLDAGLTISRAIDAALPAIGTSDGADVDAEVGEMSSRDGAGRGGPLGALAEVASLLALGADPATAWRPAAGHDLLDALATAAQRSALGGVRLADAARESAAEVRGQCRRAGDRRAGRASVAITAPLALCFLPAFICLGLAPVVVSLISTLHIW